MQIADKSFDGQPDFLQQFVLPDSLLRITYRC